MYFDTHRTRLLHSPVYLNPSIPLISLLPTTSLRLILHRDIYYGTEVGLVTGMIRLLADSRIGARKAMVVLPRLTTRIEIGGLRPSRARLDR